MPLSLLVPRRERTPRTFIAPCAPEPAGRSEEHTSELQSRSDLVCRLLLEKKKKNTKLKVSAPTVRLRHITQAKSTMLRINLLDLTRERQHSRTALSTPTAHYIPQLTLSTE